MQVQSLWVVLLAAWSGFAVLTARAGGFLGRRLLVAALFLVGSIFYESDLGRVEKVVLEAED